MSIKSPLLKLLLQTTCVRVHGLAESSSVCECVQRIIMFKIN